MISVSSGSPDKLKLMRRNVVLLYCLTAAICGTSVMSPTLVLYWRDHGVTVEEASALEGGFALMLALLCLPGGFIADRWGRKKANLAGSILFTLGMVFYLAGTSFWGFLLGEIMLAVGCAAFANQTMMTDSVRGAGGSSVEQARAVAKLKMVAFLTWMIGALLGGYLATFGAKLPMIVSLVCVSTGILFALGLTEAERCEQQTVPMKITEAPGRILEIWRESPALRGLLGVSALFAGLLHAGAVLFAPYWRNAGLGLTEIGALGAAMHFVSAMSARSLPGLRETHGDGALRGASFLGVATGYMVLGVYVSPVGALFALLLQVARAYTDAVLAVEVERAAPDANRGMVLGLKNSIDWFARCLVLMTTGLLAGSFGTEAVFVGVGLVAALCGIITVRRNRVPVQA